MSKNDKDKAATLKNFFNKHCIIIKSFLSTTLDTKKLNVQI